MLELDHISYSLDGRVILTGLSGMWTSGAAVALLGASGSGKSTLLKLIAGFLVPSEGAIRLNGRPCSGDGFYMPPNMRRVAMAFQNSSLWPHMTVRETLAFACPQREGKRESIEKVARLLKAFELSEFADRRPHQLSGGQAQGVNLARAIAMEPDILLLDEPFTGMDPLLKTLLVERMKAILQDRLPLMILATHYAHEALALVDELVLLRQGTIYFRGPAKELAGSPDPYLRGYIKP